MVKIYFNAEKPQDNNVKFYGTGIQVVSELAAGIAELVDKVEMMTTKEDADEFLNALIECLKDPITRA